MAWLYFSVSSLQPHPGLGELCFLQTLSLAVPVKAAESPAKARYLLSMAFLDPSSQCKEPTRLI